MKKVVHFEVHFVILYSKTELLNLIWLAFCYGKRKKPADRSPQAKVTIVD